MKGSASGYGLSAGGEKSKMDYQEQRKDNLISFGFFLGAMVLFIAVLYYVFVAAKDKLKLPIPNPFAAYETAKTETVNAAMYPIPVTEARDVNGNYYAVTTQEGLEQKLKNTGILQPLVVAGNTITGGAATQAGAVAAQTVNRLGLNNEYDRLDPLSKTFVSIGEGAGMIFGVDVIQMGYDMRKEVEKSVGVV